MNHEFRLMAISSELLHKQAVVVKQICRLFPMSRGSCSLIWQRDSYWEAHPSSKSKEYPRFLLWQNFCSSTGDASWSERSSSNFGVSSVESEKKHSLDSAPSTSFNYSTASACSIETQKDLQKGISLLKKSVACITTYCNNIYCLDTSTAASTFEAFAKVLATLSFSKEMKAKLAQSKFDNQLQPLNKSAWNVNSTASISSLLDSLHSMIIMGSTRNNLSNSAASFL